MSKKKILLVEDEPSIIDTVSYALSTEGFEPLICRTAQEAVAALRTETPALGILDVGLPDMSGFDLCRLIRQTSALPILFLTARSEEVDRVVGLEIGADDYMVKPFSPRELVARVRAILRRTPAPTEHSKQPAASNSSFEIDDQRVQIFFKGSPIELSRLEYKLLSVLIRNPGRVYSRDELMDRAWEEPDMSLARTVDTHIKTIRGKLRAIDPSADPIVTHRGFGYSLKTSA
ncbi:MAG: two-component system response regulator CreB [Deltaproteobacteria bacterium]|nr:two-component system response regulator CreB [Deltaproteobacteria bacterium]